MPARLHLECYAAAMAGQASCPAGLAGFRRRDLASTA